MQVHIFSYLSTAEKQAVSYVCRHWANAASHPSLWRRTIISGAITEKDCKEVVENHGAHIRHVVFSGLLSSEIKRIIEAMTDKNSFNLTLDSFTINFKVKGQSGADAELIPVFRHLFAFLKNLKTFSIHSTRIACAFYMLSPDPVTAVIQNCRDTLENFELVNYTLLKFAKPLQHIGSCKNLVTLSVSPQHFNDSVLLSLISIRPLEVIKILCNRDISRQNCHIIPSSTWLEFRTCSPKVKIEFYAYSLTAFSHLLVDTIPLSLIYFEDVPTFEGIRNVKKYNATLETFAFVNGSSYATLPGDTDQLKSPTNHTAVFWSKQGRLSSAGNGVVLRHQKVPPQYAQPQPLPATSPSAVFDSHIITFVSSCKLLHTFIFSEAISCSVLLLMVDLSPNLRNVYVRKSSLLLDGQRSNAFRETTLSQRALWFKNYASSMSAFQTQMCRMLSYPWQPLSDATFISLFKKF